MNQNEIYLGFENFKEQNFLENEEAILTMQIEIEEGNEKLLIKTNVPVDILRQHVIEVLVFQNFFSHNKKKKKPKIIAFLFSFISIE